MSINITCDTSIGELVKESDVSSYLSQIKDTLSDYSTTVKKQITSEMTTGGLSTEAYNTGESSSLYIAANDYLDGLKFEDISSSFASDVLDKVKKQRKKELNLLEKKVTEKINSLQNEYNSTYSTLKKIYSILTRDNNANSQEYMKTINQLKAQIDYYKKKLAQVQGAK